MVGHENVLKEKHKLPVDVRSSKTSVLKLPNDRLNTSASLYRIAPCLRKWFSITLLICILETESSLIAVIADWYTIYGKFVSGVFFEIKRTLTIFPTIDVLRNPAT